jgi:hypothetical protein
MADKQIKPAFALRLDADALRAALERACAERLSLETAFLPFDCIVESVECSGGVETNFLNDIR